MVVARRDRDDREVPDIDSTLPPVSGSAASINAAVWSRQLGHDQAQLRAGIESILTIGGQRPVDAGGLLLHEDDLAAQIALTLDNLTDVVTEAGMSFADVAHLRIHTISVEALRECHFVLTEHLDAHGATPPITVVGVTALSIPGMQVEIDGLAVRAGSRVERTPT